MANGYSARGSLRVMSTVLSVEAICEALGARPERAHDIGEPWTRRNRAPRTEAVCIFDSGCPREAPLETHLEALLGRVEAFGPAMVALRDRCDVDVFLGFFAEKDQASIVLPHDIAGRAAALGLDIVLDLYGVVHRP